MEHIEWVQIVYITKHKSMNCLYGWVCVGSLFSSYMLWLPIGLRKFPHSGCSMCVVFPVGREEDDICVYAPDLHCPVAAGGTDHSLHSLGSIICMRCFEYDETLADLSMPKNATSMAVNTVFSVGVLATLLILCRWFILNGLDLLGCLQMAFLMARIAVLSLGLSLTCLHGISCIWASTRGPNDM